MNAQVAIGTNMIENKNKINEKYVSQFLGTETIFLFSSIFEKSLYEQILKDTWTITPYKVYVFGEINLSDYITKNYSFAIIDGRKVVRTSKSGMSSTYFYTYFSFFTYNLKEKTKEIEKFNNYTDKKKKDYDLFKNHKQYVAGFYLFQNDVIIQSVYSKSMNEISISVNSEDVFYNYKPGFLKNYFQVIQSGIKEKKPISVYDTYNASSLKKLQNATLLIPNYISNKYNPNLYKLEDTVRDDDEKEDLFSKYEFKYEYIDDNLLNEKILNNEDIYYLRYVRMNSVKFLNIVEAKTGKIIYSDRILGLSYNLKSGHIKDISTAIKKAK